MEGKATPLCLSLVLVGCGFHDGAAETLKRKAYSWGGGKGVGALALAC